MIKVDIYRNRDNKIYGFKTENHGDSVVCAAVSALCLNAANSIETFTDLDFCCDLDEEGGFLEFSAPSVREGECNHDVELLLNSMLLGLGMIESDYPGEISVNDKQ